MALLVAIAAIMLPIMGGTMSRASLLSAGDVVRTLLTQARLDAMKSGQVHIFRCEIQGNRFQILSLTQFAEGGGELPPADETEYEASEMLRLGLKRLPSGVVFAGGDMSPSQHLAAIVGGAAGPWSPPIVFQPDGTASDATLLLANEYKHTLRVTLRGLTGIALVGEVGEEALQ
jgi:hypothetical protein